MKNSEASELKSFIVVWALVIIIFIINMAIFGGLGWVVAWALEKGLNFEVNYNVFVYSGLAIGFIRYLIKALSSKTKNNNK